MTRPRGVEIVPLIVSINFIFQYVMTARRLKYYGFMKFPYCQSEYPQPLTELTVYIGNKELIVVTPRREEIAFKVTRMKTWRITLHHVRIILKIFM